MKFASKANKDKLVSIQTDEFKVSWGLTVSEDGSVYSELNKVKGVENEALKPNEGKTTTDVQSLGKAVSGIIYEDAFGDYLDVRYSIAHQKVKEDLILNEKSDFRSYRVTYNVNNIKGVYAVLSENGEVTFYNEDDEALFKAGLPVMYDDAGEASADIQVNVVQGKKTIEITYTPSSEWLSDEDRVYPVTIDPYIQSSQYTSNIMDTSHYPAYGGGGSPTNARAVEDRLYIGTDEYACIKFHNVPYIPDSYTVNGVEIQLYGKNYPFYEDGYYIYAANITEYWNEYMFESNENDFVYDPDITYFSYSRWPQRGTQVTTQNPGTLINEADGLASIQLDIKPILDANGGYQSFFDSYYGFLINDNDGATFLYVYSSEYENSVYRPSVVVRYSNNILPLTQISSEYTYRIRNYNTGNYLTFSTNDNIYAMPLNSNLDQEVKFVYNTVGGYYNIQSTDNPNYYVSYVIDIPGASTYSVWKTTNFTQNPAKWKAYTTSRGTIKIVTNDEDFNFALYANPIANSLNDYALVTLRDDNKLNQEWELEAIAKNGEELVIGENMKITNMTINNGQSYWFSVTPRQTDTYCFYSTGTADTYVALHKDSPHNIIATSDNDGDSLNFNLTYALNAGTTYYYEVKKLTSRPATIQLFHESIFWEYLYILENMAMNYADDMDSAHELVCQLIRQTRYNSTNYGGLWDIAAGEVDAEFLTYVQTISPLLYNYMTETVSQNEYSLYAPDGSVIDTDHLFATLNVLLYTTIGNFGGIYLAENRADNLGGWAMDLRTLIPYIKRDTADWSSYSSIYNTTLSYIGDERFTFSMPDLYADTDAYNISNDIQSSLYNAMRTYYFSGGTDTRYTDFTNEYSYQTLYEITHYMISTSNDINAVTKILDVDNNTEITLTETQHNAIAKAYTDLIWSRVLEEEN